MLLLLLLLLLQAQTRVSMQRYSLKMETTVTVEEGLCVHVPCEIIYPYEIWTESDPAYGYWFREQNGPPDKSAPVATNNPGRQVLKEAEGRFLLTGDPGANNCSLDIRDARKTDEGSFVFRLERGQAKHSYKQHALSVHVIALTHSPNILIAGTLAAGQPSTLTCSVPWACERGTPPIFSWMGSIVSHLGPNITSSPVLSLSPLPRDHGTTLTCRVTLPAVSVNKTTTVHLNISYPPQNLTVTVITQGASSAPTALVNSSSLPVMEGQALRLLCAVDSYPPARLTWTWENLILSPSEPNNPGVLELSPRHLKGEGEFTCLAQNSLGSQHISLSQSLHTDKEGLPQKVTLGAITGASITALFFLFVCIILVITWSCRKKSTRLAASSGDPGASSGSASQGPMVESQPNESSSHQPSMSVAALASEEEGELHYASLSFHEVTPRHPQNYEKVTSEYSEIKIREGEAAKTGSDW